MDFIIKILEDLQSFFTSEKVLALVSTISTTFVVISGFISKFEKRKIKFDNETLERTLKIVQENYTKYVTNSEKTVEELNKIVQNIVDTMKNQNEALEIAFNNSNLNASAKLLVQEKLRCINENVEIKTPLVGEDENKKVEELPTQTIKEEVKDEQKQEFVRVK